MKLLSSIQVKLTLLFLAMAAAILGVGFYSSYNLSRLSTSTDTIFRQQIPTTKSLQQALIALEDSSSALGFGLAVADFERIQDVRDTEASFNQASIQFEMYTKALLLGSDSEAFQTVDGGILYTQWRRQNLEDLHILPLSQDQGKFVEDASQAFNSYYQEGARAFATKKKILRLGNSQELTQLNDELNKLVNQAKTDKQQVSKLMKVLISLIDTAADTQIDKQQELTSSLKSINQVVPVVVSMTTVLLGILIAKLLIIRPIEQLAQVSQKIAQGDLKVRVEIHSQDELGQLGETFNHMAEKLYQSYQDLEKKARDLQAQVEIVQKQNVDLEDTKKAMLNLLDDAKELEEQLREEKESVEKKVEERTRELRAAKVQDEAILAGIGDGVFAVDKKGSIILFNNAASLISGFDAKEVVGKHYRDVLRFELERDGSHQDDFIQKALKGKRATMANHVVLVRKDRLRIPVADSAAPIFDAQGKVQGAVVVFRDVATERELDRMKDDFFSIASHELRTPLTAIRGNTALIEQYYAEALPNKDLKEMLNDIHEASIRLIDLVHDFLDVGRLEQGRIAFKKEPLGLAMVVEEVVHEVEGLAKSKRLSLTFENPERSIGNILADRERLKQVITNLLSNAIKFTEKGGAVISLEKKNDTMVTRITDTGIGISQKDQGLLFQKFKQAGEDIRTRDITKGSGLGLYIAKLLVEGMRGKIYLERSEPGKGSTFAFTLPMVS